MSVYDQLGDKYKAVPYRSVRSRPEWPESADWFFSRDAIPNWVVRIEQRAAEAHAEILAAGTAARRSIGQLLRREAGR